MKALTRAELEDLTLASRFALIPSIILFLLMAIGTDPHTSNSYDNHLYTLSFAGLSSISLMTFLHRGFFLYRWITAIHFATLPLLYMRSVKTETTFDDWILYVALAGALLAIAGALLDKIVISFYQSIELGQSDFFDR